jgi:DNA-directed RNA polymerase III subunit RPC4
LPAVLPRFKLSKQDTADAEPANDSPSESQPAAAGRKQTNGGEKIPTATDAEFDQAQEGRIGSLLVYKSGKMKMKIGSVYLEVRVLI